MVVINLWLFPKGSRSQIAETPGQSQSAHSRPASPPHRNELPYTRYDSTGTLIEKQNNGRNTDNYPKRTSAESPSEEDGLRNHSPLGSSANPVAHGGWDHSHWQPFRIRPAHSHRVVGEKYAIQIPHFPLIPIERILVFVWFGIPALRQISPASRRVNCRRGFHW